MQRGASTRMQSVRSDCRLEIVTFTTPGGRSQPVPLVLGADLPELQATWQRATSGHSSEASQSGKDIRTTSAELRAKKRQEWEAKFRTAFGMDDPDASRRANLQQKMVASMENLPQVCMQETRAWYWFELLGWALVLFQGGVAYCIMANLLQTPLKIE